MDHRYYYDCLEAAPPAGRAYNRVPELAAAGAVVLSASGHFLGLVDGTTVALPCALAAVLACGLHRLVLGRSSLRTGGHGTETTAV